MSSPSPHPLPPGHEPDLFAHRDTFQLRDLWRTLVRRRSLIALCALAVVLGVGAYTWWAAPLYEATASVRIDPKQTPLPVPELLKALTPSSDVETELEVLRSRSIAEAVVERLALQLSVVEPRRVARDALLHDIESAGRAQPGVYRLQRGADGRYTAAAAGGVTLGAFAPGERVELGGVGFTLAAMAAADVPDEIELRVEPFEETLRELRRALRVTRPSRDAAILEVRYRSHDPMLVRDVPNAIAQQFISGRQQIQKTEVRSTVRFIQGQLDTLHVQLSAAEDALRAFREGSQAVDLRVEASAGVGQLAELQAQHGALSAERAALARLLAEVQAAAATALQNDEPSPYRRLVAFPSLLRNQAAAEMLRSLAVAEDQRSQLLARRSLQDPDVQIQTQRILELERQIHELTATYLAGLANQASALETSLAQFGDRLGRIPAKELEYARLRREAAALEEIYALLQTRLKEAQIAQAAEDPSVRVVDEAVLPYRPLRPKPVLNLVAALCFGLLLGSAAALGRDYLDHTVRSRRDAMIATGMPVLGLIPRLSAEPGWSVRRLAQRAQAAAGRGLLLARSGAWRAIGEMYLRIHTNVAFARPAAPVRTLMDSSALAGEGKTTTATNLAISLARAGLRVVLVDADLRRGCVHEVFGAERGPGLAEALQRQIHPQLAVRSVAVDERHTLDYLAGGAPPASPAQLLGSERMRPLLEYLGARYEVVILDTPPINLVADAALLGSRVDGALLVARAGTSRLEALAFAAEQLRTAQVPLLGTVINDLDFERDAAYDDAYQWYGEHSYSYLGAGDEVSRYAAHGG